jgi:hypothetical protein
MGKMTAQEAAYRIIKEHGPMTSREIARIALENKMVFSNAKDPILSIAATIEKNINHEIYNTPRLKFEIDEEGRRVIAAVDSEDVQGDDGIKNIQEKVIQRMDPQRTDTKQTDPQKTESQRIEITLDKDLFKKVSFLSSLGFGPDIESTIVYFLVKGIETEKENIRSKLDSIKNEFI